MLNGTSSGACSFIRCLAPRFRGLPRTSWGLVGCRSVALVVLPPQPCAKLCHCAFSDEAVRLFRGKSSTDSGPGRPG